MGSEQEFERTLSYATAAMDLLTKSTIPPSPQFFELFYTYATGINPILNARINDILRDGDNPTIDVVEQLYVEFIQSSDLDARINSVSQRMSQRIDAVHDAIDSAMATASSYSALLKTAAVDLVEVTDSETLRTMSVRLLRETRRMQDTNRRLEQKLTASRDDISNLQRDLDEVRRESLLDPLTKISNRKSFDEGLLHAIVHARKSNEPLALMMFDIDHFKSFNDTFGHQTGDQVLRLVATTLKSNTKGRDLAARYGGEEFAAILPSTDLNGAVNLAENIRVAIQAKELLKRSTKEKLGRITASFGVAMLRPDDTQVALIERADRCLYAAKHQGRNKVVSETDLENFQAA